MRINACITNGINLLLCTTDTQTVYFDFEGRDSYLLNLFTYQNCIIAYKIGSFNITKRLVNLDKFSSSLITLFNWKESTINVSSQVICKLERNEDEYALADVATDLFEKESKNTTKVKYEIHPYTLVSHQWLQKNQNHL